MPLTLFTRSELNPILKPDAANAWESLKVYNPAAIYAQDKYHLFYRAVGSGSDWHSAVGHAESNDGINFIRDDKPLLDRTGEAEKRGLEDPRIVKIGDTYYLSYAAYDGLVPRISLATSKDLKTWNRQGFAFDRFPFFEMGGFRVLWSNNLPEKYYTPAGTYDRTKSAAIFPEKIHGKYRMLFNEYLIWMASSDDGMKWEYERQPFLLPREGRYFDNVFVETGPPPIKTERGWLVLYHGVDATYTYRLGVLILDLNNPAKILSRSDVPVFWPEADWEKSGLADKLPYRDSFPTMTEPEREALIKSSTQGGAFPKVIYCCGTTLVGDTLQLYYGAGDTCICTARASLKSILLSTRL